MSQGTLRGSEKGQGEAHREEDDEPDEKEQMEQEQDILGRETDQEADADAEEGGDDGGQELQGLGGHHLGEMPLSLAGGEVIPVDLYATVVVGGQVVSTRIKVEEEKDKSTSREGQEFIPHGFLCTNILKKGSRIGFHCFQESNDTMSPDSAKSMCSENKVRLKVDSCGSSTGQNGKCKPSSGLFDWLNGLTLNYSIKETI